MKSNAEVIDKRKAILDVARTLIKETGDFDLPMRQLAATAQVSLRTPYEYFGSKAGVIGAILAEDQQVFKDTTAQLRSADELENIFDRVRWGIDFYALNQPFYRALYRATQAYSPGHTEEPARESLRSFQILASRARRAGFIRSEVDTALVGEALTDIFGSEVRTWARDALEIQLVSLRICFGFAAVLNGVAAPSVAGRLTDHILTFQRAIHDFGKPAAPAANAAASGSKS